MNPKMFISNHLGNAHKCKVDSQPSSFVLCPMIPSRLHTTNLLSPYVLQWVHDCHPSTTISFRRFLQRRYAIDTHPAIIPSLSLFVVWGPQLPPIPSFHRSYHLPLCCLGSTTATHPILPSVLPSPCSLSWVHDFHPSHRSISPSLSLFVVSGPRLDIIYPR